VAVLWGLLLFPTTETHPGSCGKPSSWQSSLTLAFGKQVYRGAAFALDADASEDQWEAQPALGLT
jgi:hypothetical protein